MEEFQNEDDLSSIKPGSGLVETAELAQVAKELAAGNVVKKHIERIVVGEGCLKGGDERMTCNLSKNSSLMTHMVNLLKLDDLGLSEDLESMESGIRVL